MYSQKRQTYLIDQGFTFKILSNKDFVYNKNPELKEKFVLGTKKEQEDFLIEVLSIDNKLQEKLKETDEEEEEEIKIITTKVDGLGSVGGIQSLYIDYLKD